MKKFWLSVAIASGALALASCSTAPRQIAAPAPPPAPAPSPYKWTVGNADKAHEAMVATFGRSALNPGEYLWAPAIPAEGQTSVIIDLYKQLAYIYRGDQLIGATTISSGKKGHETPLGYWSVVRKQKMYRSRKYDNAPMPFAQIIDDHGIALHGGQLPGYPASHGCVRLPVKFAEKLFTLTKTGDKVTIEG